MNRLLAQQLDDYLALAPLKVNTVFNKYGIARTTPINVETVVQAYQYFKEPFAVDLFTALYPEIKSNMVKPTISNGGDTPNPSAVTSDPDVAESTSFWDGFANVLNALSSAAPGIGTMIYNLKNGNGTTQTNTGGNTGTNTGGNIPGGAAAPQSGFDKNILIYIGVGFAAVVAAILVFKKA